MQIDPKSPLRKQTKTDVVFLKQNVQKAKLGQNCIRFSIRSLSADAFFPCERSICLQNLVMTT